MAIAANVEYRVNYVVDALLQPSLTSLIEFLLWLAIFRASNSPTLAGFDLQHYLAYALWGAFFGRISSSWMYEFRMTEEIESGSVNGLLVRPLTFYEYYLSQLMGYKFITSAVSFLIPFVTAYLLEWPVNFARIPGAVLLVFFYLALVHSISFVVCCCAFFLNRVSSLTVAKNLAFWILTGELIPLDLMPEPYRSVVTHLPFAAGVYLPVGYITGRVSSELFTSGFVSVGIGLVVVNAFGAWFWKRGLAAYTGTGA